VPVSSTSSSDLENVKSSLRKLQGYLLKHRGGANFGAGVLGSAESETMKESLTDVLYILRSEVDLEANTELKAEVMKQVFSSTFDAAEVRTSNQMTLSSVSVVPSPIIEEKEPVPVSSTSSSDLENVQSSLRKLQGCLLKHRGGPNFGEGFLGSAESETMKESLTEVLSILRSEVGLEAAIVPGLAPISKLNIAIDNNSDNDYYAEDNVGSDPTPYQMIGSILSSINVSAETCRMELSSSRDNISSLLALRENLVGSVYSIDVVTGRSAVEKIENKAKTVNT